VLRLFLVVALLATVAVGSASAALNPAVKRASLITACFRTHGHKVTDANGGRLPKGATAGVAWFADDGFISWNADSYGKTVVVAWAFGIAQMSFKHNVCVKKYSTHY
jgi:hypothetical protein